jgi:hypothetical protein
MAHQLESYSKWWSRAGPVFTQTFYTTRIFRDAADVDCRIARVDRATRAWVITNSSRGILVVSR